MAVTIHDDMLEAALLYEHGEELIFALLMFAERGVDPDPSKVWYPTFVALKERARLSKEAHDNGKKGGRPKAENQGLETPPLKPPVSNPSDETQETRGSSLSREEKSIGKVSRVIFIKPSVEEIQAYISEQNYAVNAQAFFDYYESVGWTVGKGKRMKDWKAAVRTWQQREKPKPVSNGWLDQARQLEVV